MNIVRIVILNMLFVQNRGQLYTSYPQGATNTYTPFDEGNAVTTANAAGTVYVVMSSASLPTAQFQTNRYEVETGQLHRHLELWMESTN